MFDKGLLITDIHGGTSALKNFRDVYVVGAGKAASAMAEGLCVVFRDRIVEGAISVPYGERIRLGKANRSVIAVTHAAHPVPDKSGVEGSKKILQVIRKAKKNDLIFVLISGGGSSLLPLPARGLTLLQKQRITERLLRSGATIDEMNTVRKHLSSIKGGQLLRNIDRSSKVISLVLSDVIGDDMSVIASGPTYPDSSTFADALKIVRKYDAAQNDSPVVEYLVRGAKGHVEDTPKPGDPLFSRVRNVLIGNNALACKNAAEFLQKRGVAAAYLGSHYDGEAKDFGWFLGCLSRRLCDSLDPRFAIVLGGETTVSIRGTKFGIGGRNQEAALGCAIEVKQSPVLAAFMGTDGIDGNSDAAGAIISEKTILRAEQKKVNMPRYLASHDSYRALKKLNSLLFTGRTGTNVNDIAIICRAD